MGLHEAATLRSRGTSVNGWDSTGALGWVLRPGAIGTIAGPGPARAGAGLNPGVLTLSAIVVVLGLPGLDDMLEANEPHTSAAGTVHSIWHC